MVVVFVFLLLLFFGLLSIRVVFVDVVRGWCILVITNFSAKGPKLNTSLASLAFLASLYSQTEYQSQVSEASLAGEGCRRKELHDANSAL